MKRTISITLLTNLVSIAALASEDAVRQRIEADLKLELQLRGPKKEFILPDDGLPLELTLRNTSDTTTHRVVIPGDGSAEGWREPHVYFTATIDTGGGNAQPVRPKAEARCGNFDSFWEKDVRALQPGQTWKYGGCMNLYPFEFRQAGRVKLVAHYEYRARPSHNPYPDIQPPEAPTGVTMDGIPPFSISSAPLEFDVVMPLRMTLTGEKPVNVGTENKISEILDIQLTNCSSNPLEVVLPVEGTAARMDIEINIDGRADRRFSFTIPKGAGGHPIKLDPEETVRLDDIQPSSPRFESISIAPQARRVQARATYITQLNKKSSEIISEWVDLEISGK